jgi:hypothetical protein
MPGSAVQNLEHGVFDWKEPFVIMPASDMFLLGDIRNLLRGLAAGATAMPPGEFRDGYHAALVAVGIACGIAPVVPRGNSSGWDDESQNTFLLGGQR